MAIKLLDSADPLATDTSHSTLSVDGEAVVVTACSDIGIAASAGSVFMAPWSSVLPLAFSEQSTLSPAPVWETCVFAKTT